MDSWKQTSRFAGGWMKNHNIKCLWSHFWSDTAHILCNSLSPKLKKAGQELDDETKAEMEKVRETYERELDCKHAASKGLVDAIVTPENLRNALQIALQTCLNTDKPHIGAFVLPAIL